MKKNSKIPCLCRTQKHFLIVLETSLVKKKKKAVPNTGTQKTERWPCTFPQRSTSQDLIIDLYKDNT